MNFIENTIYPVGFFLGLTRAFDCICHDVLLNKIQAYAIRGNALNWIVSFLRTVGTQFINILQNKSAAVESFASETVLNNGGVPQESILGSALCYFLSTIFLWYCTTYQSLYADDGALVAKDKNDDILADTWNDLQCNAFKWFSMDKLLGNAKKKYLRFHLYQISPYRIFI